VDDSANVTALNDACRVAGVRLGVLVEVNIGMHRCGVEPGEPTLRLSQQVDAAAHLDFLGFQAYEGHLVLVKDPAERANRVAQDFAPLGKTIDLVKEAGLEVQIVSGGGTGTFDLAAQFTPLTEVQVGSYVLMDKTYNAVRTEFPAAISVMSTVVSRPVKERLVTDAGLKSISSEFGWPDLLGIKAEMNYLSEEHAVLTLLAPEEVDLVGGDRVQFIPSHVCTTVNLHDWFYVHQDGRLIDVWEIAARGCSQ
jgi:D-serine deaminase-like pyridoxal phosphate-dependent protein